jgi:hypothetical protein
VTNPDDDWPIVRDAIRAAIDDLPDDDPLDRFQAASGLWLILTSLAREVAAIRARSVTRLWDANQTSLAGLGELLGVTRGRAHQMLKADQARRGDNP